MHFINLLIINSVTAHLGHIYFQTNDPKENMIVSSPIRSDGTLGSLSFYSTGGIGLSAVTGVDGLFSQDSVIVGGDYLFAVNSGSNSLSSFLIRKDGTLELKSVVNSGGQFPISAAYCNKRKAVCVLNGGAVNGVQCFRVNSNGRLYDRTEPVRFSNVNQTTPPKGPAGTFSDIVFSPDGQVLFVTFKGNPAVSSVRGFVAGITLSRGFELGKPTISRVGGLPFGLVNIERTIGRYIFADPVGGYGIFDAKDNGEVRRFMNVTIPGQKANCWVAYSKRIGNAYLTDPGTGLLNEVHVNHVGNPLPRTVDQYNVSAGMLDLKIVSLPMNDFAYVLGAGTKTIRVVSLRSAGDASVLQTLVTGLNTSVQGFAVKLQ